MLCPFCSYYAAGDASICPKCGKVLPQDAPAQTGVAAIRQGRRAQEAQAAGLSPVPQRRRQGTGGRVYEDPTDRIASGDAPIYADPSVYDEQGEPELPGNTYRRPERGWGEVRERPIPPKPPKLTHPVRRRMINWAKVTVALIVFFFAAVLGLGIFLQRTTSGQRIMARLGFDANSTAMWEVGAERMDVGDISGAISYYLKAVELDGEDDVNVPGLLQLGAAYEAAGMLEEAEALYVHIYTDIAPSATDAYSDVIRIMLADGRDAEAADLMLYAYQTTGSSTFSSQRSSLIPSAPSVNIVAGYYEEVKTLRLTSAEGYDIYYTFDEEAELPAGGTKYEGPITLDENTWPLRAVCVNGDLVSDQLSATYQVSMPSPTMPYPSLAANTYEKRQRVRIYQNIERTVDPNITIYYTIDGSTPDADSPIFNTDDKGILLPGGRVTLRAVSVNEYGKASNTLEVGYKIEAKPYPLSIYSTDDTANGLRLNGTTYTDFTAAYGEATQSQEVVRSGFDGRVTKYTYSWGYAVFHNLKGTNTLIELYFTSTFKGPRSTGIGSTLDQVVGKFCDMLQPESPSGNRGLYSKDSGVGKIYVNGNGTSREGESQIIYSEHPIDAHVIRYTCETADSHTWSLDYITDSSDKVVAIDMLYIP